MVEDRNYGWPPIGAPLNVQRDEHWSNFDSSVNAVSFGFVATAILISMFLAMAIFERFLRPNSPALSPSGRRSRGDIESQIEYNGKLGHPSPKVSEPFFQPGFGFHFHSDVKAFNFFLYGVVWFSV